MLCAVCLEGGRRLSDAGHSCEALREMQSTQLAGGGNSCGEKLQFKDGQTYSGSLGAESCKRHGGREHGEDVGDR